MNSHILVGIDLGDKNSVARIAADREKSERFSFLNTRAGRARLFWEVKSRAQKAGQAKIVMAYEASSCGFILRDEAVAQGIDCWVLAPTKMEKSVELEKQKNDDRDANDVFEKLRGHILAGNRLPTVWVPDVETRQDRELVRTRLEIGEKLTQVKTQIRMLLKRHGIEKPSEIPGNWTKAYRAWIERLGEDPHQGWGARASLGSLRRQLEAIENEIQVLDQAIRQLSQQQRHKLIVTRLMEEQGVGLLTALVYRTEIGYAGRFKRGRHVGKYVGLNPRSHESGQQKDRKGHITRQGSARLRKALCQAGWIHVRHDLHARQFHRRLVEKNPKKKKIALVAVMRRLAIRLWHRMREAELEMTLAR